MTATTDPSFPGLVPTGRRLKGPASELIELASDDGSILTAIVYDAEVRSHEVLRANARLALNFMECPMVAGLADLVRHDLDAGWYVYATGPTRTVYEVLKAYRDTGAPVGARAALELCYLAGMAVLEAGESGPTQGVFSHGDLGAHRVLLSPEGQVVLIGHGLPQVEIHAQRAGDTVNVREESLRYCPPERLIGAPEDPTADLLSLTLLAYEMITSRELYQGSLEDVRRMAEHAEGPVLLQRAGKDLPAAVREWMEMSLQFDPNRRLEPNTYIHTLYDLLGDTSLGGDPLATVASRVFGTTRRGRQLASTDATEAIPRRALQRTAGGAIGTFVEGGIRRADDSVESAPQAENRWGTVARGPRVEGEEAPDERRRRRGEDVAVEEPARRRRRGEEASAPEEPVRRRRRGEAEEEPVRRRREETEEVAVPERRRRREPAPDERVVDELVAPPDAAPPDAALAPADEPASPERRRRREPVADEPVPAADTSETSGPSERRRRRPREE